MYVSIIQTILPMSINDMYNNTTTEYHLILQCTTIGLNVQSNLATLITRQYGAYRYLLIEKFIIVTIMVHKCLMMSRSITVVKHSTYYWQSHDVIIIAIMTL